MLTKAVIDHLRAKVGAENVYHEREDLLVYGYDATPEIEGLPDVAVFPDSVEGVKAALSVCRDERMIVTPRGAATGLSGGSTPIAGGMVLGLTRMNRILEIDEENLTATAEAGVITVDLFNAAAALGLFYPPDPGSQNVSTLGGNVAENAGGLRGFKYGVTRNYVMALKGLLYDGTEFQTGGKCVKDVAGYSLRDLLVGSEGTLGIITEVTVRLITPPQDKRTLLAYFRDIRTAGEAVSRIIAARIIPATLEIMDRMTINCVEDYMKIGLPREMAALLLIEVDGHPAMVAEEAEGVRRILEEVRADEIHQAGNAAEAARLTAARRTALSAVARVSPTTILEDATVPRSRLAETFGEIERLKEKYQVQVATFGHAGDGNLHPTALADERNPREIKNVHAFFAELYEKVLSLGGTVSGEHGIGIAKKSYLLRQFGEGGMGVMRRIKDAFDPGGRLNPGKIFIDRASTSAVRMRGGQDV
ncbi:MAG: glycolate oxidase subunit GlcD [Syntrophus sp. RIFOXYC2_FULL_54_9]|nr:MAG: glycolate oxidase subunit GlcD [Syntrophus sp. RIFOXYC2_FULL_54_9]